MSGDRVSEARAAEIYETTKQWGRWGAEDERGTLNLITPDVVRRAAACVKRGQVFSLGLPFGADGPQPHDHFLKAQLDWQEARVKAGAGANPSAPK